ncbi:hypothetical protein Hanom_Chr05g00407621 [Helianthus anomalus]
MSEISPLILRLYAFQLFDKSYFVLYSYIPNSNLLFKLSNLHVYQLIAPNFGYLLGT